MAVPLVIHPHGDGAFADLQDPELAARVIHIPSGLGVTIAGLKGGMASGNPSVMIRIDVPNGPIVLAETSLRLFLTAADALKAAHGDPRS